MLKHTDPTSDGIFGNFVCLFPLYQAKSFILAVTPESSHHPTTRLLQVFNDPGLFILPGVRDDSECVQAPTLAPVR